MNDTSNLKQSLSMGLQDDLDKNLLSGEQVVVSLPGSFGEALVVTDKRIILLRDCDAGLNTSCNVYDYPFAKVKSAQALSSSTGGYIELQLTDPVDNPDNARVFFPSYEQSKFEAAAKYITEAVAGPAAPSASAGTSIAGGGMAAPVEGSCPGCGFAVLESMVFCEQCGRQLKQRCQSCSHDSSLSAKFCSYCGRVMEDRPLECAKCGAKVMPGASYCTQCGSSREVSCVTCGAQVAGSHTYCWNCGRLIGSDRLDHRAAQAVRTRFEASQSREQEAPSAAAVAEPAPAQQTQAASGSAAAEEHNTRGRAYFENDDTESAIREFQLAVSLEPGNASYHYNLAVALDEDGQDEQALAEYNEALRLNPNDTATLLALGYMYNENEEPAKAQAVWNKVLEIAPDSADAQEVRENLRHQQDL